MSQVYVSGPVQVFVAFGAEPQFLGWCSAMPRIQIRKSFSPCYVDIAGQRTAYDYLYDGQEAIITGDITRFNYGLYQTMTHGARTNLDRALPGSFNPGEDQPGDVGTLQMTELVGYKLYLKWPYQRKDAMIGTSSLDAMPAGYRFRNVFLEGPDDISNLGTVPLKIHCVWHATRILDIGYENDLGAGLLTLYDNDMSELVGAGVN